MKKKGSWFQVCAALATGSALFVGTPGVSQAATSSATISFASGWNTIGIINPQPQATGNVLKDGIAYAPLAYSQWTTKNAYWPVLAKNWQVKSHGNIIVVQLNPQAKWSNGAPVTANDVYVTFEMQFMVGNAQSWGLTHVQVVNPHTIVFYKNPQTHYVPGFVLQQILNNTDILPAADFAKFIPAHFWTLIRQSNGNPAASVTKNAHAVLGVAATRMEGYNFRSPSALLYDGAWSFARTSASEQLYVKNPYFVFAKRINAQSVLAYNGTSNDVDWRLLENGQVDFASVAVSIPSYKAIMSVHQNHWVDTPYSEGMSIMFNQTAYPFNMVQVRQALAYLIKRSAAQRVGDPVHQAVPVTYPDGMTAIMNKQYLTAQQLKTINPYAYNPSKGIALLKSVGFKKTSKGWMMPNGKPFTVTIYAPPYSNWDAGIQDITSQLSALGIRTSDQFMDTTVYYSPSAGARSGKFPVAARWWGGWEFPPFYTYNQVFVTDDGWTINNLGHLVPPTTSHVHTAPTTMTVPGIGTIHPQALVVDTEKNLSPSQLNADVYKLAKAYNYSVPAIPIWNGVSGHEYSTAHWSWPNFKTASRAILNQLPYSIPFVVYETLGLMHPKS